jgi:hypothetical protein
MKKTAVEWLEEQMKTWGDLPRWQRDEIIQQAKEMEKQQIIEAHGSKLRKSRGVTNYEYWYTGEDFYNETYKK